MNKQKGMTLLEVLVALAIFSLAGLTLLQTTAQQARNAGMMKRKCWQVGWPITNRSDYISTNYGPKKARRALW